jgi:hypothetical protein
VASPSPCRACEEEEEEVLLLLDHEAVQAWLGSRWLPSWADFVGFGLVSSSPYFFLLCFVSFFFFFYFLFLVLNL